jgi:hypothetical protein
VGSVLETADRLWTGDIDITEVHPFAVLGEVEEVADGVAFVPSFANVSGFRRSPRPRSCSSRCTTRRSG